MAQTIKLKRTATPNNVPTTAQLELGEIAVNTYDGKVYIKKNDGAESIVEVTNSSLGNYLPLAGGTLTGTLAMGANAITSTGTISSGAITSTGILTLSADTADTLNFSASSSNTLRGISFQNWSALTASTDGYLRLNGNSEFSNGVYTPANFRADGSVRGASYTVGATEVIDSSRNITAGAISSGAIAASGDITTQGWVQHTGVLYSRNNLLVLNTAGNGWNTWATRSSGIFNLNVGTIFSEAITSTGNIFTTGSAITVDPASGDAELRLQGAAGAQTLRLDQNSIRTSTNSPITFLTNSTSALKLNTDQSVDVTTGVFKVGGTTVIDSSRNLTNIGTISSGAITSSGPITVNNVNDTYNFKAVAGDTDSWFGVYDDANNSANIIVTRSNGATSFLHLGHSGATTINGTLSSGAITSSEIQTFTKSVYGDENSENYYRIKLQDQGGVYNDVGIGQTTSGNMGFNVTAGQTFIFNGGTAGNVAYINSNGVDAKSGGFRINGITVIDSSRNLTNIGTISSGNISADSFILPSTASAANQWIYTNNNNTGTGSLIIQSGEGSAAYGGGLRLYSHSHASKAGWVTAGISAGSGGKFSVNNHGIGSGTDVFTVDASGNTVANGTISSGAITSTGQSFLGNTTAITGTSTDATANVSYLGFYESDKTTRQGYIGFGSSNNNTLYIVNDVSSSDVAFNIAGGNRVVFGVNDAVYHSNINIASSHVLQIGGTTVIDASRNLTNIGTISSGAITSSGQINAGTNLVAGTSVYSNNGVYYGSTTLSLKNNTSGSFLSFAANTNATFAGAISSGAHTIYTQASTLEGINLVANVSSANQNSDSPKIQFNGEYQDNGPYIQGDNVGSYGYKSLKFYTNRNSGTDYTTAPTVTLTLDFNGNAQFSNNVSAASGIFQGNVGIGVTDPSQPTNRFHVKYNVNATIANLAEVDDYSAVRIGNFRADGDHNLYIGYMASNSVGLQARDSTASGTAQNILINPYGGLVGIGTTAPQSVGSGYGALTIGGSTGGGIIFNSQGSGFAGTWANTNGYVITAFGG